MCIKTVRFQTVKYMFSKNAHGLQLIVKWCVTCCWNLPPVVIWWRIQKNWEEWTTCDWEKSFRTVMELGIPTREFCLSFLELRLSHWPHGLTSCFSEIPGVLKAPQDAAAAFALSDRSSTRRLCICMLYACDDNEIHKEYTVLYTRANLIPLNCAK
jgi:hypothetical protein